MVSPLYLIAAALGFAFLHPLIEKLGERLAQALGILVMAFFTGLSAHWFLALSGTGESLIIQTAGFAAPLSISLMLGEMEAFILLVVNLIGLLALVWQQHHAGLRWKGKQIVLFFVMILGVNGLVLTRDLFNVFVFMEISAISLYGLLATSRDSRRYEAGFKYMIAGGLSSTFYLIGIAFLYRITGTLSLDSMLSSSPGLFAGISALLAMVFFTGGILIELKPVFANGWALDSYQAADPGLAALLSSLLTTGMLSVMIKVFPLVNLAAPALVPVIGALGSAGFLVSGLMALNQKNTGRMLGLSSIAQTGLILLVLSLVPENYTMLPVLLLLNHALAKAGIFWISELLSREAEGRADGEGASAGSSLRSRPFLLIILGMFVFSLLGLPPFPSFWVKWTVLDNLVAGGLWWSVAVILGGSLLEAAYLFKWFLNHARSAADGGETLGEEVPEDLVADTAPAAGLANEPMYAEAVSGRPAASGSAPGGKAGLRSAMLIPALASVLLFVYGMFMGLSSVAGWVLLPVAVTAFFALLDVLRIPQKLQVTAAMLLLGAIAYLTVPAMGGIPQIFMLIFLGGTLLQLPAFLSRRGSGDGLMALVMGLTTSLAALVLSRTALELFFSWEFMTVASFLLILRGRKASAGALRYMLFSLFSAYSFLGGLLILKTAGAFSTGNPWILAFAREELASVPLLLPAAILVALAVLTKLGALGFHLWLPASYAEAEDDVSSLLSSVLSKAGVFVLLLFGGVLAARLFPGTFTDLGAGLSMNAILGWAGALTAVAGAFMALFQEDIKYTLAYSSMGQLGYIILAFATMSHLGYLASLYLTVTHLLFKGMLWLAVLGVIQQTGTRLMYRMGGLIKAMPFSFLSVLIAIIAVSGVPPLSGFGGKWLIYSALMEKGWYLQAAMAMFSSGIAFLYLYRLIHSIFLGQPKDELAQVREAPFVQLLPQFLFMAGIMVISMFPNLLLHPLQAAIEPFFPSSIQWDGYEVISSMGYWNGNAVMYVTMGVFALPLISLLISNSGKKLVKVKQFNIVYAAERPYKPQTTHYAYNFFAPYQKALGFLATPWTSRFWLALAGLVRGLGDALRRWNTGNAQTYGFQIVLLLLVLLLFSGGGNP